MTLDVWCLLAGCHIVIPTQISPNLCTGLVTVQILMKAFRWLFFSFHYVVCVAMRYDEIHTCACACTFVCVCLCARHAYVSASVCVCTTAHLIRLVYVGRVCSCTPVCAWVCVCVRVCVCVCKVSHLSRRWLRVSSGGLDRWVHCSTLAAVASAQVTASPNSVAVSAPVGGRRTDDAVLVTERLHCEVRDVACLFLFRFVSLQWKE